MRVFMLSKACLVGIYQRKLEFIAQHNDVALKVFVPPSWEDERGEVTLERAHTQGYSLQTTPIRFNGSFHMHYYPKLGQELRAFQPHIVHIDEEPYNLATWFALRAAKRQGAKTLFFSWQNIKRRYPFPFSIGEQWVLRNVDYALMGTQSAAEVWQAKGYQGEYRIIPQFGVDMDIFSPPEQRHHTPPVIGYIGRLVPEKGGDTLLDALALLKDLDWTLQITGGGPELENLQTRATRLGIRERITFRGQVPSLQMPHIYRELEILVVPSRTLPNWKEQFGRVIIEAMASGTAVIGSDSGAIPDVIGEGGCIFPENDTQALAQLLRDLLADPARRIQLQKKGYNRVLRHFTQAQVAAKTVEVYRELLGR